MGNFSKLLNDLYYKGGIFTAGITCLYLTLEEVFPRNVYSIAFGLTGIGLMGLITGFHMPEDDENNSRRFTVILNKLFNGLYYDGGIFTAGVICIYLTREQVFPRNAYSVAFGMTGVGLMGLMSSYHKPQGGEDVNSHVSVTKRYKSLFNKILCGLFYRGGLLIAGLLYLGALPKKNVPRYIYSVTFGVIGTGLVGMIAGLTTGVEVEIYTPKRYRELVGVLFYKGTAFVTGILCSFLTQKGVFPMTAYNFSTGLTLVGLVGLIFGILVGPEDPDREDRLAEFYKLKPELEAKLQEQKQLMLEYYAIRRRFRRIRQMELQSRYYGYYLSLYEENLPLSRRAASDICLLRNKPDVNLLVEARSMSLCIGHLNRLSKLYCVF